MNIYRSFLLGLLALLALIATSCATCPPPALIVYHSGSDLPPEPWRPQPHIHHALLVPEPRDIPSRPMATASETIVAVSAPSYWLAYTTPLGKFGHRPEHPRRIDEEVFPERDLVIAPTNEVDMFVAPDLTYDVDRVELTYGHQFVTVTFAGNYGRGDKSGRLGVILPFNPAPGTCGMTIRTVYKKFDPATHEQLERSNSFTITMVNNVNEYRNPRLLLPYAPKPYAYGRRPMYNPHRGIRR